MLHRAALIGILLLAPLTAHAQGLAAQLSAAALERITHHVIYDGSYRVIAYPMGDVPSDRGVCADEIIRAYRSLGIDLQQLVHEDMTRHFAAYPKLWGLAAPDANIDHRRVPNLERFFIRHGTVLPVTSHGTDYRAGDIVSWRLIGGGLPHIGIVTDRRTAHGTRPLVVHNIGLGPQLEDVLFAFPLFGHYRYDGPDPR
jgi:uncharacterized protein YijF (DUF1287 family)